LETTNSQKALTKNTNFKKLNYFSQATQRESPLKHDRGHWQCNVSSFACMTPEHADKTRTLVSHGATLPVFRSI